MIPNCRGKKLVDLVSSKCENSGTHNKVSPHSKKLNVDETWKLDCGTGSVWNEPPFEHKNFYSDVTNEDLKMLQILQFDGDTRTKVSEIEQREEMEEHKLRITEQTTFDHQDHPEPIMTNAELASILAESSAHDETQEKLTNMLDELTNLAQNHQEYSPDNTDGFHAVPAEGTDNSFTQGPSLSNESTSNFHILRSEAGVETNNEEEQPFSKSSNLQIFESEDSPTTSVVKKGKKILADHQESPPDNTDGFHAVLAEGTDNSFTQGPSLSNESTSNFHILRSEAEVETNNEEEQQSNSEDSTTTLVVKKGRKRLADPLKWQDNLRKKLRNTGQEYMSKKNKTARPARSLKPTCTDCIFECKSKFSEEERQKLFLEYWEIGDITRQREFITRQKKEIISQTENYKSRKANWAYYFTKNGKEIRVCKLFFMNTLAITRRTIQTSREKLNKDGFLGAEQRGKHGKQKRVEESIKQGMRDHINSIPRIESHYLRNQTTRQFIDGGKTIASIYRDYVDKCGVAGNNFGSLSMFTQIFNYEFNLSFFTPKKDQCEVCSVFENSDGVDEEQAAKYKKHQEDKQRSRIEKEKDKTETGSETIVCVYDLQAALPCPISDVSVYYYKMKLATYNFTIYDIKSKEGFCHVWHEGESQRGANEIASCVLSFIEDKAKKTTEDLEFIFYSDNCPGQNKNKYILAMYMYALHKYKNIKSIVHKFLIKGHTQNEGDNMHSVIEKVIRRARKSGPIYVPAQYTQLIRTSKKTVPYYQVKEMDHNDFIDFKSLVQKMGKNLNVNSHNEAFNFNDIKVIKVDQETPPFVYHYKTSYDDEFKDVDLYYKKTATTRKTSRSSGENIFELWGEKKAYAEPTGISLRKKKDLMSLLESGLVPATYHEFYNTLRVSK